MLNYSQIKGPINVLYYIYSLTSYQLTRIQCDIWCNLHDKFSYFFNINRSSGRWHSIPMKKKNVENIRNDCIITYQVSLLPISSGRYEFTCRACMKKIYDVEYKWLGNVGDNCTLLVLPSTLFNSGYTPNSGWVRQIYSWFEDAVCTSESNGIHNNEKDNIALYNASVLAGIALESDVDVFFFIYYYSQLIVNH